MKMPCKLTALALALVMCLCLGACGDDASDAEDPAAAWDVMTAAELAGDSTAWQGDDGSVLTLRPDDGTYVLNTWYGRTGLGTLFEDESGLGLLYGDTEWGEFYFYLVREDGGFTLRNVNGEAGREYGSVNGLHFVPAQSDGGEYDPAALDGVWQNALGTVIAIDTGKMRFVKCNDETMSSAALYDDGKGEGIYLGGEELLFPCLSADGSSLVFFGVNNSPRMAGADTAGVFYRDGAAEEYAEPENAYFEENEGRLWYCDGVRIFAVPEGYALHDDGQAYDADGEPFAPEWPETNFDAAAVWGENWAKDSFDAA